MQSKDKNIFIGCDHAGFATKQVIKDYLTELGYKSIKDFGAHSLDLLDDYPDFIAPVAMAVSKDPNNSLGITLGGSGQGEAMLANRFPGVRAAVYYGGNIELVKLSREHNDSNIISFGARFLSDEEARSAVLAWLSTPFSDDQKYLRRIEKAEKMSPDFFNKNSWLPWK